MLEAYSKTDIGRVRSVNEDSLLIKKLDEKYLLAVADGLGGYAGGEVASKTALIEIEEFLKEDFEKPLKTAEFAPDIYKEQGILGGKSKSSKARLGRENLTEVIEGAISKANSKIYHLSKENPAYTHMGTTLVMAVVFQNRTLIANIGDSRAYLVGEEIKRITKDHSLVQELLDKKLITEEEAFQHPQGNIITKVLGTEDDVVPDFYEIELSGNFLLLCSDGLSDALRDEEIRDIVIASKDLDSACAGLVDMAIKKGGQDNITVILAKG